MEADQQRTEWTEGDPCPECGHDWMVLTELTAEEVRFEGEEVIDWGNVLTSETKRIECANCWEVLRHSC